MVKFYCPKCGREWWRSEDDPSAEDGLPPCCNLAVDENDKTQNIDQEA